jgi:hypothetical protein
MSVGAPCLLELPSGARLGATEAEADDLVIAIWIACWRRQYERERADQDDLDLGGEG